MPDIRKTVKAGEYTDLSALNETQKKAVTFGEGPLLVLAGPGSGKTFTITRRIFYLLTKMQVPPEKILVITFTKEAAVSMQERFRQEAAICYPVKFGTFHSVFYHILRESRRLTGQRLLSNQQKTRLLIPILRKIENTENLKEEASEVLAAFGFYKNTGDIRAASGKVSVKWQPCFRQIFQDYEQAKRKEGGIDFDDMLSMCLELLRTNKEARVYWQNRFSHILIDEFQDINPIQYQIVRLLTKPPHNLFAVGDDDQSIYGFRGSGCACLKTFAREYHASRLLLDVNYRSRREIVEASLAVIEENKERFAKKLKAAGNQTADFAKEEKEAAGVSLSTFETKEEQYEAVIALLLEKKGSRAVLFRTNYLLQCFAARLWRHQIPYELPKKQESIYEHFIVKDVTAYLEFAKGASADKRSRLLYILNKPARCLSREMLGEGEPDFRKMEAYCREEGQLKEIRDLERHTGRLEKMPLKLAVTYIRRAVGYEGYLRELAGRNEEKLRQYLEILTWLEGDVSAYDTLKDWTDKRQVPKQKEIRGTWENPVKLLTVHGSKGLEFDHVFLPDCNEKVFPAGSMTDSAACEEERRIFYVAMTRAKKSLGLFCTIGTKERPRLPSRFLNPLWRNYSSSTTSSNSHPSRYSSKASATFSYSSSSSMKESSGSSLGSSGFSL